MSDQSNGSQSNAPAAGNEAGGNQQATQQRPSPLVLNAQYIKDLSFENPNAPQTLAAQQKAPQVSINVDVQAKSFGQNRYEVVLNLRAEAKQEDKTAFLAELAYAGLFTLQEVKEEHVRPLLLIECPRLLFPFARAIIAEATRDGGYPPLMINPIDFTDLYRRQAQKAGQAQQSSGEATAAPASDAAPQSGGGTTGGNT